MRVAKLHGLSKQFYDDGKIWQEDVYENDNRVSNKGYDKDGNFSFTKYLYENGFIGREEYDMEGKLISSDVK